MTRIDSAIVEKRPDSELYVGCVPGLPAAHSQEETLDELNANLLEVIALASVTVRRCDRRAPHVVSTGTRDSVVGDCGQGD